MNGIKGFFKSIFSPEGDKISVGSLLILAALVLIMLSFGMRLDPAYLATSPLARQTAPKADESTLNASNAASTENSVDEAKQAATLVAAATPAAAPAKAPAKPATAPNSKRADMILIPKIGTSAPLITPAAGADAVKLKNLLDRGAVIYPDSAGIGKMGQSVVLGHSAPPNWPKIKHDTIFSRIIELAAGDKVMAVYNDKTYTYEVLQQQIIAKGSDIPAIAGNSSSMVLVTCWPPGRDLKRLVVEAKLESVE